MLETLANNFNLVQMIMFLFLTIISPHQSISGYCTHGLYGGDLIWQFSESHKDH